MAEYFANAEQIVPLNETIDFTASIPCNRGLVIHEDGTGVFTLRGCGSNCFARYKVTYNGNIAIPADGTVAAIAAALALNGEELQYSRAIVTPAAVEQFFNVTCTRTIDVPKGCCSTLSVRGVNAGVGADIEQQAILFADGNLDINRIA